MINKHFIVITCDSGKEDAIATMRCKNCEELFEVHFFILKPVNCSHELGTAITITCPACKTSARMTKDEAKEELIRHRKLWLRERIDEMHKKLNMRYEYVPEKLDEKEYNLASGHLPARCLECHTEFSINMHSNLNCAVHEDSYTVTCPECKCSSNVSYMALPEQLEIISYSCMLNKEDKEE